MAELTWDEKNKLALARRAEEEYQFWATGGLNKPKHDTGGDGGSRRGGKAKYTMSKVFDDSGETLTETNLEEDGSETKVVKKTPSSLLDNESYDTPILGNDEVTHPSIATPPEPDADIVYGSGGSSSGRWGGPARAGFMGQTATRPYGPIPAKDIYGRDRWLTEDEYTGAGNASRWLSRPSTESIESDVFGTGIDIEQSGSDTLNDQGTLAVTDKHRADAQTAIIDSINNHGMMELYNTRPDLYKKVIEGEMDMPLIINPHEGMDYTTPGFDGSSLHSDSVPGSFVSETFDRYRNEDGTIVDSPLRSDAFDEDNPLFTTLHPEVANEASKLEKNLDDADGDDDDGDGKNEKENDKLKYDSINTLAKEDPEKIKVLNRFASWMEDENVSDAESLRAAEDYLENLRNEPTVHDRVKKAMAIAFAAMLFGDDLTTAMNTGFGVVADDYAAEEAAEAAEAEAAAALQKTLATEARANAEWDRRKIINEELDYAKWLRENKLTESKEAKAEAEAITSGNFNYIKDRSNSYWNSIKGTKAADKFNNINDFQIQMDRAYDWMNRNWKGLIDFENNVDQRVGFEDAFAKWMRDKQIFDAPAFENYIQDAFIKIKFAAGKDGSDATYIEPSLIAPTAQYLSDINKYDEKTVKRGKESVAKLYNKVESQVIPDVGTEKHALMLLKKDFNDFKNYEFDGTPVPEDEVSARYAKLLKDANDVGEGVFTRFVLQNLPPKSIWGYGYDPEAKGKSAKQLGIMAKKYLESN